MSPEQMVDMMSAITTQLSPPKCGVADVSLSPLMSLPPIKVCITGAAGQIAYSLLPQLLKGNVFGSNQPIIFSLLDLNVETLRGVVMELEDLSAPLYVRAMISTDAEEAFEGCDFVIFLGALPRREGFERKDLMARNVGIFRAQGAALAKAKPNVKCVVVGANTNALILADAAPSVARRNITALTRLDHNRAMAMVARKAGRPVDTVEGMIIWGNHSSSQYPDVRHATIDGVAALSLLDRSWAEGPLIETVQGRGAAVISARGVSSAASAAKAICDHMRDWTSGTNGRMVSVGMYIEGALYDGSVPHALVYSVPCTCADGEWRVVDSLPIDEFSRAQMEVSAAELAEERALSLELLAHVSPPPGGDPGAHELLAHLSPPPGGDPGALHGRVDSDLENLQLLHEVYGWPPGGAHVRPSPTVRAQKDILLRNLSSMWASSADWVFHHVFAMPTKRGADGKRTAKHPAPGETVFARNPFPYDVPRATEHWVFWMASNEAEWPDERIDAGLSAAIAARGGGQYIWYPNPKMSVPHPNLFHVQVFWRPREPACVLSDADFQHALGYSRGAFGAMPSWKQHQLLLMAGLSEVQASLTGEVEGGDASDGRGGGLAGMKGSVITGS